MEQAINALNVEVGVFLRNLRTYSNRKDVYLGNQTIALLTDAISCIDKLITTGNFVDVKNEIGVGFLDDLDERYFELRRNIVCRLCIEPISISKEDFEAHMKKVSHVFQARNVQTVPVHHHLSDSQSSKPAKDTWELESSRSVKREESTTDKYSVKSVGDFSMGTTIEPSVYKEKRGYETVAEKVNRAKREQIEREHKQRQEQLRKKSDELRKKEDPLDDHVIDVAWKGVRVLESSDTESSDSSSHGFNYDSIYLMEVRGLPPSATRQEIKDFLKGISILNGLDGIHFILDEKYRKDGRAFIQLELMKDYQSIQNYHMKRLGDRYIEVTTGNIKKFKEMVVQRKIPSKDRVVFIEGLPPKNKEQDIRSFFQGLQIHRVHFVQSGSGSFTDCAFVKFSTMNDVESAIKQTDKASNIRIYRSTDQEMRSCYRSGLKRSPCESTSSHDIQPPKDTDSKSQSNSKSLSGGCKYVRVRGIPLEYANEQYVYDLFPGLEIDRKNGIQMEHDAKDRKTGSAFVEIKNAADFDMALHADLKSTNRCLKVTKATKAEFFINKEVNAQKY